MARGRRALSLVRSYIGGVQRHIVLVTLTSAVLSATWACEEPAVVTRRGRAEPEEADTRPAEPTAVGRPPADDAERTAIDRARRSAQQLGGTLKTRLMGAMAEGPAHAASFCADNAELLSSGVAGETGVRLGRSSLRLRNPHNAGPDWVVEWLEEQGERPAAGVTPAMGVSDDVARFVAPIAIEGPCLSCHGPAAGIDEAVRALLGERYPTDRATGYATGDLRGAIWAEAPIAR